MYCENGRKTSLNFSSLSAPTSGFVYRNCTVDGWSEMYPPYEEACAFSDDNEPESEVHTLCCCNRANQLKIFILFLASSPLFLPRYFLFSSDLLACLVVYLFHGSHAGRTRPTGGPLLPPKHQRSRSFRLLAWNWSKIFYRLLVWLVLFYSDHLQSARYSPSIWFATLLD